MPLALSALLAFMLGPLVRWLCHWRLPRAVSVVIVTLLTFSFLGLIGWLLGQQAASLADELPNYQQNINKRIASIQHLGEQGFIAKIREIGEDFSGGLLGGSAPAEEQSRAPTSDQVEGLASKALNTMLSSLAGGLGTTGIVIVFVIFLLLRQDDMSQRIVKLAGFSRLTTTTRALDEVGERVSHYLLMQGTINGLYGVLLASGLAIIGMPYVILWGVLAAIFRYIPYIGPIIVALLPISFSLAFFEGWTQPLIVIGFILGLELVTNMVLEPVLYGRSTGVSDLSVIIAIAFWTWLWGSMGLVLATPMTVCIVVFCKYIPSRYWGEILMGDKPKPEPHLNYYQQLISDDRELAHDTIEESVSKAGLTETLETVIMPTLALVRREVALGKLTREEHKDVHRNLDVTVKLLKLQRDAGELEERAEAGDSALSIKPKEITIFARALHGHDDALALEFLSANLPSHLKLDISQEPHLIGELIARIEQNKPDLICISAIPPDASTAAITICRRFRNRLPNMKILVCRWSLPDQESDSRPLLEAGATWVAGSVKRATEILRVFGDK